VNPAHTACIGARKKKRTSVSKFTFLKEAVPNALAITTSTKPRDVRAAVQHHYGHKIDYQAAHKVLATLQHKDIEYEREEFKLLPAYVEVLKQADPDGRFVLQLNDATHRFERLFIGPSACRTSFRSCTKLVACDGTFTKSRFRQTLLFAVTVDGNDEVMVLAWALVESENEESWAFFFRELDRGIPEINRAGVTLISDRDKGLVAADRFFPRAKRAYCCQHIADNIQSQFGMEARGLFWAIAHARTEEAFHAAFQELEQRKPPAARYLAEIQRAHYATAFFPSPGRRYGHLTSNIVESANALFLDERELPVLDMLDGIWRKEMHRRTSRLQRAIKEARQQPLTPWGRARFQEGALYSEQNDVWMESVEQGLGTVGQRDGRRFQVNLEARTCGCKRFQDTDIPCGHAITVIHACQQAPADYLPEYIRCESWVATYQGRNIPQVDLDEVKRVHRLGRMLGDDSDDSDSDSSGLSEPPLDECTPPLTRAPRGRPAKKRKRRGDVRRARRPRLGGLPDIPDRAPPRCSTCNGVGHYARTCSRPHV
jgi:hypothetical protein